MHVGKYCRCYIPPTCYISKGRPSATPWCKADPSASDPRWFAEADPFPKDDPQPPADTAGGSRPPQPSPTPPPRPQVATVGPAFDRAFKTASEWLTERRADVLVRANLCKVLVTSMFKQAFPGVDTCRVDFFGSIQYDTYLPDSDVDLSLVVPRNPKEYKQVGDVFKGLTPFFLACRFASEIGWHDLLFPF